MKDFNAKKQDLVSSSKSMSTKGIGTTVDATRIQFHAYQSIQIKMYPVQTTINKIYRQKTFKKSRFFEVG
jgi:hypothetical protein